jgi:DNA (cytosine-5)-methyltransferase 1
MPEKWPTPTHRDYKDTGDAVANGNVAVKSLLGRAVQPTKKKGSLDPEFVEYLMGFPIGWTDSKHLEMPRFRQWLEEHG